ncbi:MAG: hypothetical protein Q7R22_016785 [Verrucomicrobiota bacterium JB025]|nr:hypothetical protein [Verrucomicrobiota bacterium JB025]
MKFVGLPLVLWVWTAGLAASDDGLLARFRNGDRLRGDMASLSPEVLEWESPLLEGVASFGLEKLLDISMPAESKQPEADHVATISLTNGDQIRGELISVTEDEVVVKTWYAGMMRLNRLMVDGVSVEGISHLVYRGPVSMDGWVESNSDGAWTYGRSAFRSHDKGSLALDGVLPDEVSVSFDVAWKGDVLGLKVLLFSRDAVKENPASGSELSFQRGNASLRNGGTQKFIGNARVQAVLENDRVRMEIKASSKTGTVCLYVDDELVQVWQDPDIARGGVGRALHFVSPSANPLRISRIEVAPWDGEISEMPVPNFGGRKVWWQGMDELMGDPDEDELEDGRMRLANGDTVKGDVTSISDGQITIATAMGEISVPVSRFRDIALPSVDLERCIRRKGDVRAWFNDDTSVVFRLDAVSDGSIEGSSQNFGKAVFDLAAFKRLEFNIYDWSLKDMRLKEEW